MNRLIIWQPNADFCLLFIYHPPSGCNVLTLEQTELFKVASKMADMTCVCDLIQYLGSCLLINYLFGIPVAP